jgi:cell filamentation protein
VAKYSLDPIAANCYPDTAVLINKLGIRDDERLLQAEMKITQVSAARWERSPQSSSFDFEHYKVIHKHLFEEIYDWAGLARDVDISKKGVKFCPFNEIENYAGRVFDRLRNKRFLSGLPKNKFVSEFIDLYIATNYLHPFRDKGMAGHKGYFWRSSLEALGMSLTLQILMLTSL